MRNFAKSLVTSRGYTRRIRLSGSAIAFLFAIVQMTPASAQVNDAAFARGETPGRRYGWLCLEAH